MISSVVILYQTDLVLLMKNFLLFIPTLGSWLGTGFIDL